MKRFICSHSFLPTFSSSSLGFLPNLLLCSMEWTGGNIRGCRRSNLQGDMLEEKLSKWREDVFASRVLCQARAAPGLPPLPVSCWMLNQLFVPPCAAQGTNSLAEGCGMGTNKGFIVGMVGLFSDCLLQARIPLAKQTTGAALRLSSL